MGSSVLAGKEERCLLFQLAGTVINTSLGNESVVPRLIDVGSLKKETYFVRDK